MQTERSIKMSKIKNLALALGTVAALGVAILPLTAYADNDDASKTLDVNVNVNSIISMSLSANSASTTILPGNDNLDTTQGATDIADMSTTITVSTNSPDGYVLTLTDSDDNANLQTTGGATIAPISSQPAGSSNPGWAVLINGQSTWYAVPTQSSGNSITVKNYTPSPKAVTNNDTSKVYYGVGASSDQATGHYLDTVTYTATAS